MSDTVTVTDGDNTVELPPRLAKLLLGDKERGWKKGRARRKPQPPPAGEEPIPMSHIPGVVPEVSMREIRHMVDQRMVDVYLDGRTKKVLPSEVLAAFKAWKG